MQHIVLIPTILPNFLLLGICTLSLKVRKLYIPTFIYIIYDSNNITCTTVPARARTPIY